MFHRHDVTGYLLAFKPPARQSVGIWNGGGFEEWHRVSVLLFFPMFGGVTGALAAGLYV
jgi:hypothetical protein